MDVADCVRLFAYVADSRRRRFLSRLRDPRWDEAAPYRELTHGLMPNILVHMMDVEDPDVLEAIQGKPTQELRPEAFETFEALCSALAAPGLGDNGFLPSPRGTTRA
ncbi:MAG: hypothetical protein ACE5MM_07240 [Nitrospiraceae bacterium]